MSKTITNQEKAEGIVDRFVASDFVGNVKLVALTARDLIVIFVPFAIATYILHTQADRLVLGLGVALALVGIVNTAKLAYGYEKNSRPAKKRK